ncbi:hypothetical protein KC19_1G251900, partial [Ceratodon purpureus]
MFLLVGGSCGQAAQNVQSGLKPGLVKQAAKRITVIENVAFSCILLYVSLWSRAITTEQNPPITLLCLLTTCICSCSPPAVALFPFVPLRHVPLRDRPLPLP